MILEFKVFNERKDRNLEDTVKGALQQIEEKRYADMLMSHGIPKRSDTEIWICISGERGSDRLKRIIRKRD